MDSLLFPMMGFARHRLGIDGPGVTTLVAASGCPLKCRYCLNRQCWDPDVTIRLVTPEALYDMAGVDDLYFQATGGGVTFGGGEPLVHAPFIRAFHALCNDRWRIMAETSLNVPTVNVCIAAGCVDGFIVDIKDMNPEIYRKYTGADNALVTQNLQALLAMVGPERITVRVPRIPGFNTAEDVDYSVSTLKDMGITKLDVFTYRAE